MADRFSDPEELARYIERTRKDLARNVDELADRVNPKNVAHRGVERMKEEADQVVKAFGALVRPSGDDDGDGQGGGIDKRVVLAGVGAAVTVTALVLWRRKRRRR